MNENATVFKPTDIVIRLDEVDYVLKFDLNAFCELEKLYDSVDSILQMLLGATGVPDLNKVTYKGEQALATDVQIAGTPLSVYINQINKAKEAKHADTLNMLWAGCIHAYAIVDTYGEITGYSLAKSKLGAGVTFKNLREVNGKILAAILRDLLPSDKVKNAEAPEVLAQKLVLPK